MVLIAIDSNMAKRLPVVLSKGNKRSREAIRVDATRQQVLSSKLLSDTYDQLKERYQGTGNSHLISITKDIEEGADPDILVARKDFAFFCEYIDPMLKPALHHRLWHKHLITEESNKYLHRIVGGDISILSPRGSSKSTVLGLFLAWAVGIHAEIGKALQILYISANRDIAKAKCETIRNLITNSNYETIFPFVQPNPKKWSNEIWSIDRAAAGIATAGQEEFTMICAGIMGTITSKRCFTGDTLIQTNVGSIMLKWSHLYSDLKVKSFNHATGKTEYRKVEAIQRSKSNRLVEITTNQGHRICCTTDHPIYTLQQGYTEAGVLTQGTELVISTEETSNLVFAKGLSVDTVSSIKLLGDREEYVYDIQVEGNNNFFANNILVHNCQLIAFDDLIKNPDEIATPAIREKMVRTLNYAIYPVLFPGGRKISINTRFRPDDVYVTEFIPAKGWTVLEQSAIIKRRDLIQLQNVVAGLEGGVEDEEELLKDSSSSSELTPVKDRLDVQSEGLSQSKVDDIESLGLAKIIDANNESLLGQSNDNVSETDSLSQDRNLLTRTHTTTDVVGHHLSNDNELYLDEEVSYWEEMWPLSHLDKLRNPETGDPIAFSFQFQNKIASVEGMGIAKEHIKYGHPPDYFDYYCIGCDLAVSKKHSADFTVFVLVGKIDNEFWVLDFWRGKLVGNQPKIEQLLRMYWDYAEDTNELSLNPYTALQITPWRIAIESVAYQASLQDDLTRELYHKHGLNHIVVMPHKMRGSKTAHVESVSGAFSNGLVTFNMGIDWTVFVKELIGVGGSEHDDCADALVIALQSLGVRKRLATFDEDDKAQAINAYEQRQRELHPMLGSWS